MMLVICTPSLAQVRPGPAWHSLPGPQHQQSSKVGWRTSLSFFLSPLYSPSNQPLTRQGPVSPHIVTYHQSLPPGVATYIASQSASTTRYPLIFPHSLLPACHRNLRCLNTTPPPIQHPVASPLSYVCVSIPFIPFDVLTL